MTYPIEPGSDLDRALDLMADDGAIHYLQKIPADYHAIRKLVDPRNDAHMRALGLRVYMADLGVTGLNNVHADLHGTWYGQPQEKP